jgi:hypothetical protein
LFNITHVIIMAGEIQRVMDAGHKVDEIVKFDRILRLLPLCGALARHPQHLELIVAGGKCSLASTLLKLVVYAMPPAVCRRLSDSYAELRGCSTLQEEIHAFADALPDAFTILRRVSPLFTKVSPNPQPLRPFAATCKFTQMFFSQISVAQRACEILGDLAAACAVLPRDASFYLMQSLEHVFSIELPANHSHLKPSPVSHPSLATPPWAAFVSWSFVFCALCSPAQLHLRPTFLSSSCSQAITPLAPLIFNAPPVPRVLTRSAFSCVHGRVRLVICQRARA